MTELMLKLAAFLAMVIDHAAACRLDRVFFPGFSKVYMISRAIGRMAFPIYAFCLVEGFRHSHDLRRYGGRLLLLKPGQHLRVIIFRHDQLSPNI